MRRIQPSFFSRTDNREGKTARQPDNRQGEAGRQILSSPEIELMGAEATLCLSALRHAVIAPKFDKVSRRQKRTTRREDVMRRNHATIIVVSFSTAILLQACGGGGGGVRWNYQPSFGSKWR
jgi:hypothetical protein